MTQTKAPIETAETLLGAVTMVLDTAPDLEGETIEYGEPRIVEMPSGKFMVWLKVTVSGREFTVQVSGEE